MISPINQTKPFECVPERPLKVKFFSFALAESVSLMIINSCERGGLPLTSGLVTSLVFFPETWFSSPRRPSRYPREGRFHLRGPGPGNGERLTCHHQRRFRNAALKCRELELLSLLRDPFRLGRAFTVQRTDWDEIGPSVLHDELDRVPLDTDHLGLDRPPLAVGP